MQYLRAFALTGRAVSMNFCPFRACSIYELLPFQGVLYLRTSAFTFELSFDQGISIPFGVGRWVQGVWSLLAKVETFKKRFKHR